jgi:hypothetical protein
MSENHSHSHKKCIVCDWQIDDGTGVEVDYQDRKLSLCSDECSEKFKKSPAKFVKAALISIVLGMTTNAALAESSSDAYRILVTERDHLAARYDAAARDVDDLEKQITAVRHNSSRETDYAKTELDKLLDDKSRELKEIEFEIRDLNQALAKV